MILISISGKNESEKRRHNAPSRVHIYIYPFRITRRDRNKATIASDVSVARHKYFAKVKLRQKPLSIQLLLSPSRFF